MTDIEQKPIPQIKEKSPSEPKRQSSSQSEQPQNQKTQPVDNNLLPLTHKKKHKKQKKKVRKHSPEYYEQLRVKKINKKLEQNWDNRFVNQSIPIVDITKKSKRRTLSKLVSEKRAFTALDKQVPVNKTVQLKKPNPLPKIQKPVHRAKSFNVHVISKPKQQRQNKLIPQIKTQKGTSSQKSQLLKAEYKQKINRVFEQTKFLNCHKELLEQFIQLISKKAIKIMIDKQLANIKQKRSLIIKVMTAIANRQKLLIQLQQLQHKKGQQSKQTLQLIDNYRTSTVLVIEQILKWKQNWAQIYFEVFNKQKQLDLIYKSQNYLATMIYSTSNVMMKHYKANFSVENKIPESQVNQKDPFLISFYSLDKQDKNIILKIRACQLLLLEEDYNAIKK